MKRARFSSGLSCLSGSNSHSIFLRTQVRESANSLRWQGAHHPTKRAFFSRSSVPLCPSWRTLAKTPKAAFYRSTLLTFVVASQAKRPVVFCERAVSAAPSTSINLSDRRVLVSDQVQKKNLIVRLLGAMYVRNLRFLSVY